MGLPSILSDKPLFRNCIGDIHILYTLTQTQTMWLSVLLELGLKLNSDGSSTCNQLVPLNLKNYWRSVTWELPWPCPVRLSYFISSRPNEPTNTI